MSFFNRLFKNKRLSKTGTHSSSNKNKANPKTDSSTDNKSANEVSKNTDTSTEQLTSQGEVGDKYIAVDGSSKTMYRVTRELSDKQKQAFEQSTLSLRASQLYMHYWKEGLDNSNRDDPEWRNTVMFFWRAEEPFPRKSLPPFFQQSPVRYFLFEKSLPDLSLTSMQAVPWFNQPGGGTKYVCLKNGNEVTIPELHELGIIEYYEAVELGDNLDILNDRDTYFFLINEQMTSFENGRFFLKNSNLENKRMPLHVIYAIGAIHIVKRAEV